MLRKLLTAYLDIPLVRDGKGDSSAVLSYRKDCEMYRKLLNTYFFDETKGAKLLKDWKEFIAMRNEEDFCTHSESKNYAKYLSMFNWRNY